MACGGLISPGVTGMHVKLTASCYSKRWCVMQQLASRVAVCSRGQRDLYEPFNLVKHLRGYSEPDCGKHIVYLMSRQALVLL